jgi:hypothetical protein
MAGSWWSRLGAGLLTGCVVAGVENSAFKGEVSPIVIVALLLAATVGFALVWGGGAWLASAAVWLCVPLPHVVKRALELPDTLHPNTWESIATLAAFSLAVAAAGTGLGVLMRRAGGDG